MTCKKTLQFVLGVAIGTASACSWHYWQVSGVLAVIGIFIGLIFAGDAVDA